MSVINVSVKNIRPNGYSNLKEWIEDDSNVYVGRQGVVFIDGKRYPEKSSLFCNKYKIGKDGTRQEVIDKYRIWLSDCVEKSPEFVNQLKKLKGKNLGCWCHPESCHADVLLEFVNKIC